MPSGLQVFRPDGSISVDLTSRFTKLVGTYTLTFTPTLQELDVGEYVTLSTHVMCFGYGQNNGKVGYVSVTNGKLYYGNLQAMTGGVVIAPSFTGNLTVFRLS